MTDILFNGQKVEKLSIVTKPERAIHLRGAEPIVTEETANFAFSYIDEKTGESRTQQFWVKGHSK